MPRPSDLPDYERPPIDEVAIGVQFQRLSGLDDAFIGHFWEEIRSDYPTFQQMPRIETPIESLASPFPFTVGATPIPSSPPLTPDVTGMRTWLVSADDCLLIQIQNDRFIHNWRKRESEYPRFDELKTAWLAHYQQFTTQLAASGLASPQVVQLEVSYINWLLEPPMDRFLRLGKETELSHVGFPQDQMWMARYLISENSTPLGRLHVQCQPAVRLNPPMGQGQQFNFSLFVPLLGTVSTDRLSELMDLARRRIVTAFTELTTPEAHDQWGRKH
jgi:uncharacterized protein (TIGR04255 family)